MTYKDINDIGLIRITDEGIGVLRLWIRKIRGEKLSTDEIEIVDKWDKAPKGGKEMLVISFLAWYFDHETVSN
jgi:hypothetical protein